MIIGSGAVSLVLTNKALHRAYGFEELARTPQSGFEEGSEDGARLCIVRKTSRLKNSLFFFIFFSSL